MAPATPSRPSTAGRTQHATPPEGARPLAEELQEVPMETDEEGEIQSPPIHPNSHEDEVKKLKKKLRDLGEQHNTLLDNAKNNAKIAQNRIEALEKKVADLAEIAESLGKTAENNYLAEYRYQAAKLNWGEEAHMAQVYLGLKSEVKDAMVNIRPKPKDLNELANIAVEIDNQQYERRKEKQAEKHGGSYNPRWNTKQQSANQGKKRHVDTQHGTEPGPMTLGATQRDNRRRPRDMSKVKCYNCNQFGHMAHGCPQPRKARDPNQGKQTLGATNEQDPQMAIRTQTLGMTRSLYDTTDLREDRTAKHGWYPHPDSSIREPQDDFPTEEDAKAGDTPQIPMPHKTKANEYRRKARENPEYREKERKREQAHYRKRKEEKKQEALAQTETLGMMRERRPSRQEIKKYLENLQGNEAAPDKGKQALKQVDDVPARVTLQDTEEAVKKEREAGNEIRARKYHQSRSMGHRGGAARAAARHLRREDERIEQRWRQPYEPLFDETGIRIWTSNEERCLQGAREHGNTNKLEVLHVRAYHMSDATNPLHKEPKFDPKDDLRTFPTHPGHKELSWVSCKYHWCGMHKQDKEDNDCFPVMIPGTPNDEPYLKEEVEGYLAYLWYENLGVVELRFHIAYYREIKKNQDHRQEVQQMIQEITEAEKEYQERMKDGRYDHLRKKPSLNDTSSEDEQETTNPELEAIARFFETPHNSRGKPTEGQKKAWRQWCRYEWELMRERHELSEADHIEGCTDPERCHESYLATIGALHERQMTEEEKYEARLKTPEEQYEELEERFQQQLFDDEFTNDCTDGEGCCDSDCERTHRDASGKVVRLL
ncbi:hypothetical protein Forpe1208_v003480 [Fusarium oxysporum f. sp. rapae]|uniref:CCHC-type domain-containing protein n=1 Tax=Fusarium oxysporum f. sp. rapae TaxID=485398 RepID=A0A8J5PGU1_FUSOX|nr:hypothetical protein Forpe1208_v001990 [Fusarium oxysporum f. sp. rapae]KAG7419847.1 hypothetical protein Forpe1208_v003649 [Fusarium oxysporum f. sp. rapae]KAG7420242.1 hypothetical protein Forpe1208_v003480 [Fusarium oxysporum f. sp. rapae]